MRRRRVFLAVLLLSLLALYHRALTQGQQCRLMITLVDGQTHKSIPGVIRCFPRGGDQSIPVTNLLARGQGLNDKSAIQDWYVISSPTEVLLPRQPLRLEAFSGLETELKTVSVDLTGQSQKSLTIPLRSFSQVSRLSWYSGNTHLHLSNLNKDQAERYLREIPRADDLDVLFISYLERAIADKDYITNRYPIGDLKEFWSTGVLVNNGEEHRHNFGDHGEGFGHVMLLNIKKLIQPISIGPGISHRGTDGTPLQAGIEEAHRQGGVAIWCHNNWGREDVPNFVSGKLDAQNFFDGGSHGSYEDSFYHYLNAGIRVPFSTGTDWFMYDLARVYTKVEGNLGIKSWLDALVAGRSFISNGPLLRLNIEGEDLGATVDLPSGREVTVKAEASGRLSFGKLQLIRNGKVVFESEPRPKEGYFEASLERSVKIDEPSWLALRVSAETSNEFGRQLFAHTSPIYVKVGGKAIRQTDEVAYLIKQMEEARQDITTRALFASPKEREGVLSVYEKAIRMLRNPGDS
jgi:TolB protein